MRLVRIVCFVICLLLLGCGSGGYEKVTGVVSVNVGDWDACGEGLSRGYSDVPGMQILIRDVDEKFLIEMEPAVFNSFLDPELSCILGTWFFHFEGEGLPKNDKYIVDAGRRGEIVIDAEDFEIDEEDGEVEIFRFSLGD